MATRARRKEKPELPPATKHAARLASVRRGTRAEALDIIFAHAEATGEGWSHGAVGIPRYGKTWHIKEVIEQSIERGYSDLVFVHDAKKPEPQYEGTIRETMAALQTNPPGEDDSPIIVLHPLPSTIERPRVEDVAAVALRYGRAGKTCAVLADELFHGLKAAQTWDGETFPYLLREGSSQHVSVGFTTQIPQQLPTEAMDLPQTMSVFKCRNRSARYAARLLFDNDPRVADVVHNLDVGEFVLADGDDWNGVIYGPK